MPGNIPFGLLIDCLSIDLAVHMLSHARCGPTTKDQGPRSGGPGPGGPVLGALSLENGSEAHIHYG